ncbi:McrC family protein [Williamsia sp. D3]|uniref:McrC family protein n=1 Tax=Williamsia sp. D3 TaxID=1313067 RepID=UPI0003D2D980|nr:restriction endonuclease [Williamsia sp. D3]ETD31756.1 restriction endonuclease [Williamsia sp. D3]
MSGHIVLDELDSTGRTVALDTSAAAALASTGLVEVRPAGNGLWILLPRKRVGAVRVDDLQVQVNPKDKVGLTRLLFLLGYAADPGFLDPTYQDVQAEEHPDLWTALAESIIRLTERALLHGVLQGYRTVDEAARTVRGRIRIGDQLARRPGLMLPLEVTYDEYTIDTAENRILRTALRRMLAVPGLSGPLRARLAHLDSRFDGVEMIPRGLPLPHWLPSRLNIRYQPALRLAEVVLRNCSAEAGPGDTNVAAFVVEMWKVFEDFVTVALRESLAGRYPGRTESQYGSYLDEPILGKSVVRLETDVVHIVDRTPRLIFDAKYKVASSSGRYPNADHYQMLAYCTALRLRTAWLVYAGGIGQSISRRIVNTDFTIVEYPLNLKKHPLELLAQVDQLVEAAWLSGVDE